MHIEFLVEEESCAKALAELVPKIVGDRATHWTHVFQGKADLLNSLPARLRGYSHWLPSDWRIVVLVDCDDDPCDDLKAKLERTAAGCGLITKTNSRGCRFQIVNRIAVEELESWFLGDSDALVQAFPGVPATFTRRRGFRDCEAIRGGAWEALERLLREAGYYSAGMPKIEVARRVSAVMAPERNQSHSFQVFRQTLRDLIA